MAEAIRYLIFYENGENRAAAPEYFEEHRARFTAFMERGVLLGVGPLLDGEGGAMGIFTSREAAEEFVRDDPFVLNKVVGKWRIREWREVTLS